MKKLISAVAFSLLLPPLNSFGAITYTKVTTIKQVWTWAQTGSTVDGDVVLLADTGLAACPQGVFIASASGSDKVYSAALMAYADGKNVMIQVFDDQFWSGSGTPYCKVRAIWLE